MRDLRAPSADHRETLPCDRKYVQFYNSGPKIWGLSPQILMAKNVQNLGQFRTASDFNCKYFRNGWRYQKLERRD